MKSLQQELQSRVSLRRNCIRETEAEILHLKSLPAEYGMGYAIRHYKNDLALFVKDQVVDKKLYALTLDYADAAKTLCAVVNSNYKMYAQLVEAGLEPNF